MKNLKNIILFASAIGAILTSCTDYERPGFVVDKSVSIEQQEEINSYDALKTYIGVSYPNFKLGTDISVSDYVAKGLDYRVVNNNFNQISFFTGAQHGDIVKADGSYDFSTLQSAYEISKENGVSIFGKNLVSYKSQNATYLNNLIKPIVVENPVVSNSLRTSGLNDGTFNNWTRSSGNFSVIDVDGLRTVKMVSGASASSATDLQLVSPSIDVVQGHTYEVIMYVRSETAGKGRISFEGLTNNTPSIDWDESGTATPTFSTDVRWKKLKFKISGFTGNTIKLHLDFGYNPNVTYYFNVASFYVQDTQAVVGSTNVWLEAECGKVGSAWSVYTDRTDASNGKYLFIPDLGNANTNSSNVIASQNITYTFDVSVAGSYKLFARASADNAGSDSFHYRVDGGGWGTSNGPANHPAFKWDEVTTWTLSAGRHTMTIAMREDGLRLDKFYLGLNGTDPDGVDNSLTSLGGDADNCNLNGFSLNRSEAEKTYIVNENLTKWITEMLSTSKDYVKAWNVLDEPMDDINPTAVKSGIGITPGSGQFFWQDYLGGKEYGVKAFQLARTNGNSDDLLFVSDYGLDSNLAKCNGLIQYVQYIENAGQVVNGIGVKMHLTVNSNKENIASMFELLAATGKQIAITEFYVDALVANSVATSEELQLQSDMYKYVLETYAAKIPGSQRFGVSINGIKDVSNKVNSIWNKNLTLRNPSYVGFSEGLKLIK